MKKIMLYAVLVVGLVAASLAFYFYNKGPIDVTRSSGIPIKASELYSLYSTDSSAAKDRFTDKIVEVSGAVAGISVNSKQQKVVLLTTGTVGAAVNCTFEDPAIDVKPGSTVRIKGICSGMGEGDIDLGIMGDVYLTRCYAVK